MYLYFKHIFDFCFAAFLLLVLSPLFIIVSFFVLATMGYPILFMQKRVGKSNVVFQAYKFRSMKAKNNKRISDESRITPFGSFIRLSRLDELPQLINIIKGDMSFIGPRLLLPEYLPYYSIEEQKRHAVRPGLSGLSQINNLNYPDWDVQLKDDVKYAENISFKLDLFIMIKTVQRIFNFKKLARSNTIQRKNFIEHKKHF